MDRRMLTDAQWARIADFLPGKPTDKGGRAADTGAVIADKGYDSDALVAIIEASGAEAIIPPRSHRNTKRKVDWHRYKARNLVERFFNRLKCRSRNPIRQT